MRHVVLTLVAVIVLMAGTCIPVTAEKETLAGRWHLSFYGKCIDSPQNRQACRDLQSPATFAIVGVPRSTLIVKGIGDYTADVHGKYTVRFSTTVIEHVPGGKRPAHCTNNLVFNGIYTGTCREEGTGHGHIARGHSGSMPDFWQDDATGWWDGSPPARFYESSTADTNNPACAGVLDTKTFMALFGYKHVPTGITARLVLTHRIL